MSRSTILSKACNDCIKELYSLAYPKVTWDDFKEQCKIYSKTHYEWEEYKKAERENKPLYEEYNQRLNWKGKSITECIGPRPYEFYYIPDKILHEVCDDYIFSYRLDSQKELLDTISILKEYCKKPIVDKYIDDYTDEYGNHHPGHRGYDHPDNLYKEIAKVVSNYSLDPANENSDEVIDLCNKFFKFLDMAGDFYNWNRDLNSFKMSVFDICPTSNKDDVINNWKKYRNKDIQINEEQMIKEYYGEDELD